MSSIRHASEQTTVNQWNQGSANPQTNQRAVADAAQSVLSYQSTLDTDVSNLQKANASGVGISSATDQYKSDLAKMSQLEQTFWEKKVGEDNNWIQQGGGAAAQQAFNSDNNALNNFRNEDPSNAYLEEGTVNALVSQANAAPASVSTATSFTQAAASSSVPVPTAQQVANNSGGGISLSSAANLLHNVGLGS